MRSLTILMVLTLCSSAAAQKDKGEEDKYLDLLGQRAAAQVLPRAKPGALPAGPLLRIFVLAPSQDDVVAGFRAGAEEWNRSEGEKHGRVELVEDASRADVILARFIAPFKTGRPWRAGEEGWTRGGSTDPRARPSLPYPGTGASAHPAGGAAFYYSAKTYSYIAVRESGVLKLLWRDTDSVRASPADIRSTDDFAFLKGGKDSKVVGDRLLGRFFKMLRERGRSHE